MQKKLNSITDQKNQDRRHKEYLQADMAVAVSQNWKLGTQENKDVDPEEVVLRVQGIICNRDLPPIQRPFEM